MVPSSISWRCFRIASLPRLTISGGGSISLFPSNSNFSRVSPKIPNVAGSEVRPLFFKDKILIFDHCPIPFFTNSFNSEIKVFQWRYQLYFFCSQKVEEFAKYPEHWQVSRFCYHWQKIWQVQSTVQSLEAFLWYNFHQERVPSDFPLMVCIQEEQRVCSGLSTIPDKISKTNNNKSELEIFVPSYWLMLSYREKQKKKAYFKRSERRQRFWQCWQSITR